jgi:CBS domain containing-hemolysin-like protein
MHPRPLQRQKQMNDSIPKTDQSDKQNQTEEKQPRLISWIKDFLPSKPENSLRDAIEELIEEKSEDSKNESQIARHERMLISNILELRDLSVLDVMVPRADIVGIDITTSQEELYDILSTKPHSRLPVFESDLDNIVGILHMKDLVASIAKREPFNLKKLMREAMVVSPAMRVLDLMLQMRQSRIHIAMVVDEFGGIDGIITINDLIEAIVGEIDDDYTFETTPHLIERPDGSVIADARIDIEHFEEKYSAFLTEEERDEVDTLGGLVIYICGHMPARGEIITHSSGMTFEILEADPRRINRLKIKNIPRRMDNSA